MEEDQPGRPKLEVAEKVSKVFGIIMVVLYFVIGTTIIFKAPELRDIPEPYALIFGIFLIFYGFIRAYKVYRKYFSSSEEE
ncbi:MAG TPA: hypothetical protein VGD65_18715 [Chryseosolibacter sp.]